MKKLAYLFILCLLSNVLFGQNNSVKNFKGSITNKNFLLNKINRTHLDKNTSSIIFNIHHTTEKQSLTIELQKLDSIVYSSYDSHEKQWTITEKYEFIYNSFGNLIQNKFLTKNDNDNWNIDEKQKYYYDENQFITQTSWLSDNELTQQEQEDYREEYTYYNDGNLNETISKYFSAGQTYYSEKDKNYYNEEGELTKTVISIYNDISNNWKEVNKDEYFYTTDTVQKIIYYWGDSENIWIKGYMEESIFNDFGNIVRFNEYDILENQTELQLQYYTLYDYDSVNNLRNVIEYYQDNITKEYYEVSKEEYFYDAEQNLTGYILANKSVETNEWIEYLKQTYNYDNIYSQEKLIIPFLFLEDLRLFKHMFTNFSSYGKNDYTEQWSEEYRGELFYSPFNATQNKRFTDIELVVYPNPAKDFIYINYNPLKFNSLKIYNSFGKECIANSLNSSTTLKKISLNNFSPGVYLFQFIGNEMNMTQKIIIK